MNNKQNNYVICKLPKAGLGNMLFPLMKAFVLAHLNNLPILITGYHRIQLGPYIRREKSKRLYNKYFIFQKNIFGDFINRLKLKSLSRDTIIEEPPLGKLKIVSRKSVYRYSTIPHWSDYFSELREHRQTVIRIFWDIIRPEIKHSVNSFAPPVIGIHIRMGDFRNLNADETFKKVGHVRTPEMYFVDVVRSIRGLHGSDLPVSIFTNGFRNEFTELLNLGEISFIEGNSDIEDMLLLSRSKIIVTSAGSTFGYWAGFLSDAPIIMHPDHIHQPIRHVNISELYEGPFDATNGSLVNAIKAI